MTMLTPPTSLAGVDGQAVDATKGHLYPKKRAAAATLRQCGRFTGSDACSGTGHLAS